MHVPQIIIFTNLFVVLEVAAKWPPDGVTSNTFFPNLPSSNAGNPTGVRGTNTHSSFSPVKGVPSDGSSDAASSGGASSNTASSTGTSIGTASPTGASSGTASPTGASSDTASSTGASSDTTSLNGAGGIYDGHVVKGEATTYQSSWSIGNCLLHKWPQPKGLGPIAMTSSLWDSARVCGACVSITSSYGTHLGIVTDQSNVKPNSLDLGPDVWSQVSNHQPSSAIPISWRVVPCNFTAPIQFYNKDGVNPQYTAIQVAGANTPIKSLEAMASGKGGASGSWSPLTRQSNSNHFTPSQGGLGSSADLRVTCANGKQIITKNVNLVQSDRATPASGNC